MYKWKEFTACTLCVWFVSLHIVRVIDVIAYCCSLFSLLYIILLHIHTTLYLFCSWWIFCVVFLFPLGVCLYRKISGKDLFKGLRVCKLRAQLGKTQKCSKEESRVQSSHSKSRVLENNPSCICSPQIGPGWLSVRCEVVYMMSQVVWSLGSESCGGGEKDFCSLMYVRH